jgi:5'(3')-deoxyribonucleotidase
LKPTRIFLDLDDVLNVMTMPTLRSMGCDIVDYDPAWGWDIVKAANATHPKWSFTTSQFWNSLRREHWAMLPKSKMCDWLIDRCVSLVGKTNVHILTSPTLDPDCLAGKLEWIQTELPGWLHRQYVITPRKHLCAAPGVLLIDDHYENVLDFRRAGGKAIVVPRPWNCEHRIIHQSWYVHNSLDCFYNTRTPMQGPWE